MLIDGRFRAACLAAVLLRAKRPTTVLFDDYAKRGYYHRVEQLARKEEMIGRMARFTVTPGPIPPDMLTVASDTAQALLAVMASMYAAYHGPVGLKRIALYVHRLASTFANGLSLLGHNVADAAFFDTVKVHTGAETDAIIQRALTKKINLRRIDAGSVCVSLDET